MATDSASAAQEGPGAESSGDDRSPSGGAENDAPSKHAYGSDLVAATSDLLAAVVASRGGDPRPQQQEMAAAVAQAIEEDGRAVIQAGTGVGKSFGYLVPTMLQASSSGKRQLVSTASLALQRQIVSSDGPAVQAVLEERGEPVPDLALLKGWSNYLCRERLERGLTGTDFLWESPSSAALGSEQVEEIRAWAEQTTTGDRDDVDFPVSRAAWSQVSVSKRECLGASCPFVEDCFPAQAREAAFAADVVVTNHALLGVYANGRPEVLPEFQTLVVDEAHDLPSRVRSQGTAQISGGIVARAARRVRRRGKVGGAALEEAADLLSAALEHSELGLVRVRADELRAALNQLDAAVAEARTSLKGPPSKQGATAEGELRLARGALDELSAGTDAWSADAEHTITWISESSSGARLLNIAPLNVAHLLASNVFLGHPVVLTSATLALGGSFEQIAIQTGIDRDGADARFLDVGTSFSPEKQAILYQTPHLPPPGRDGHSAQFYDELVDLVQASGGGALGLFSSHQGALRAAEAVRAETDLTVLLQGEDNLPSLVRRFAAEPDTCLFGTLSLWQGVDVPGPACRLVVIDRIPFPRPDDPLVQAQTDAATRRRRSAFLDVSLAPAALLMAQGAGRLLRSSADRGVVAILDSRMCTRSYGDYVRRSMLGYWPTTRRETVLASLRRLGGGA